MLSVREVDSSGATIATYVQTPSSNIQMRYESKKLKTSHWRVDVVHPEAVRNRPFWEDVLATFLPVGYPTSVSEDYLAYQIFDSLQAFSSSIAGLLASRAVLEGVGVGDSNATPTAALLLSVLQESAGRLATILFAHRFGTALDPECKRYRLAADVFNDAAMMLDCLSPALPKTFRVIILSTASVLRALCGVAAGSAKASLSAHFAKQGNLGEVNAKDASQETVISLMGMLAGSVVVSRVSSMWATWTALIFLLSVHLLTNFLAVRAVTMRSLNRQRASILFEHIINHDKILTPQQVAAKERVFGRGRYLHTANRRKIVTCKIGVSLQEMLQYTAKPLVKSRQAHGSTLDFSALLSVFKDKGYILWYEEQASAKASIVLKSESQAIDHLKAWTHALVVAHDAHEGLNTCSELTVEAQLRHLLDTGAKMESLFAKHMEALEKAGWDLQAAALETSPGCRVDLLPT